MDSTYQEYLAVLQRHVQATQATPETQRLQDIGLDSLAVIRLIVDLEEVLAIRISDESLTEESFESVGSLWRLVQQSRRM